MIPEMHKNNPPDVQKQFPEMLKNDPRDVKKSTRFRKVSIPGPLAPPGPPGFRKVPQGSARSQFQAPWLRQAPWLPTGDEM